MQSERLRQNFTRLLGNLVVKTVLIDLHSVVYVSDIAKDIKANSSRMINENQWIIGQFKWQEGYECNGLLKFNQRILNFNTKI